MVERDMDYNDNDDNNLNSVEKIMINKLKNWVIDSDIRIREGNNRGGMYGWKKLDGVEHSDKFPFIYNEIVGYSLSCYSFLYEYTNQENYLVASNDAYLYLKKNLIRNNNVYNNNDDNNNDNNYLLAAGQRSSKDFLVKGVMEDQFYAFDNGMIISGLVDYYYISKNKDSINTAIKMADSLVGKFFVDNEIKYSLLDSDMKPFSHFSKKWSFNPGSYLAKLAIGYHDLFNITNDKTYFEIGNSICDFALKLQMPDGRILNNYKTSEVVFLHPHLYACEGLLLFGSQSKNELYLESGLKGIEWALSQITREGGVPRSTVDFTEQSDCTAQLFRLLILFSQELQQYNLITKYKIEILTTILLNRLKEFFITSEGAFRYNLISDYVCSWCSMFGLQSLIYYDEYVEKKGKVDINKRFRYFI